MIRFEAGSTLLLEDGPLLFCLIAAANVVGAESFWPLSRFKGGISWSPVCALSTGVEIGIEIGSVVLMLGTVRLLRDWVLRPFEIKPVDWLAGVTTKDVKPMEAGIETGSAALVTGTVKLLLDWMLGPFEVRPLDWLAGVRTKDVEPTEPRATLFNEGLWPGPLEEVDEEPAMLVKGLVLVA